MSRADKAVRSAIMVARRQRAPGGSLSDAISSFSKDREAQFNRPSGNSDAALLASLQQHPQLAVAEPPEQRRQSTTSGVNDLGAQIDEGAKWLSGTQDDDTPHTKGTPPQGHGGYSPSKSTIPPIDSKAQDVDAYVRQAAAARGIDPDVASSFSRAESSYGQNYIGDGGSSFGPFQLHYGGVNKEMPHPGLGDAFTKTTGLDARDPSTWRQQVDFSLDQAAQGGWSPWSTMKTLGYQPHTGLDNAHPAPPPQQAQAPAPPPQSKATPGPQAQADPMSNLYNKVANGPSVASGYGNPQAMFDPDAPQAKRGGYMRRKHFDDGGDAGDGDGTAAAAAAAGYGGVGGPGSAGEAAGFGASTTGTGGFASGIGGGDDGFGGSSATGTSVGFGSPGGATTGFGGGVGSHGGVSTAGVSGGSGHAGGGPSAGAGPGAAAGPGGTGGGAGTAAGGNGFGGVPAFYDAGFGLGRGGYGNVTAAQSNTALQDALQQTQMRYGFVNGNDPGMSNSATGQQALAQAGANGQQGITSQMAAAGIGGPSAPAYSPTTINAANAQMAALHGGNPPGYAQAVQAFQQRFGDSGGQGVGNAGFGGGSPTASSPPAPSTPQQQAIAQAAANGQAGVTSQMAATGVTQTGQQQQAPSVHAPAPAPAPSPAPRGVSERVQRGGYLQRADGGIASMPTDELIEMALQRIRQRRADGGETTNQRNFNAIAAGNPRGAAQLANMNTVSAINGVNTNGTPNVTQVPNYYYGMSGGDSSSGPTPAPAAPATNTPAIASGTVGNHGGFGSVGSSGSSPIGGVPNAAPTGQPSSSTNPNGPQYSNTLDQALGTNNPTNDQIFGFTYPTIPPPKPQPVGPVSQNEIMSLSGIGQGSQLFASGGAIIMDAALNKARKAIKSRRA